MIPIALAVLAVLTVLFAAPLVLGSQLAQQSLPRQGQTLWLLFLTVTLLGAAGLAAVALIWLLLAPAGQDQPLHFYLSP